MLNWVFFPRGKTFEKVGEPSSDIMIRRNCLFGGGGVPLPEGLRDDKKVQKQRQLPARVLKGGLR